MRIQAHQITAPPAIDQNARQAQNGFLDIHRHGLARAKGRGAAHQITAVPVGHLGRAGLDRLGADLARQVFGGDLAVAMHQHHQWLGILVLHDQGLHHHERIQAQQLGAMQGTAMLQIVVRMLGKYHLVGLEQLGRRGF